MKTVYAPETAAAWIDTARDLIGPAAFPGVVCLVALAAAALFATWAAKQF